MKMKFPLSRSARDIRRIGPVVHLHPRAPEIQEPSGLPAPGEILNEIGLLLAIHLAIALAVVLTVDSISPW